MGNGESSEQQQPEEELFDRKKYYEGPNEIQLAFSPLGGAGAFTAWHTSVVVNGVEYFFDGNGIESSSNFASHMFPDDMEAAAQAQQQKKSADFANSQQTMFSGGDDGGPPGGPRSTKKMQVIFMGKSNKTGQSVLNALNQYFPSGHYDLLRKNCNSFSDVALFYCLGIRLDKKFRQMEQLGQRFGSMALGDQYQPNPNAEGFDVEKIIEKIDPAKMWKTPGYTLGGGSSSSATEGGAPAPALSAADMRAKRLEALERQQKAAQEVAADK
mmetsp:Transcript_6004/g.14871  ORF Transcript_6004/g.14871 Transcript_6004/m.14871 type:complete len:270 (+) Transcript_6004:2549-3358(+)|eukprot:g15261.t1